VKLTHLLHSTVLVETGQVRLLIDPGNYSTAWHDLTGLDAIVITHAHPDHVDPAWVPALLARNPQAIVLAEPGVLAQVNLPGASAWPAGSERRLGDVVIAGVGGWHAVIHRDIPRIGNVGCLITTPGGPSFFHPGDALDTVPPGVDVAAIPAHAPWCAMKEIIDYTRALGAAQGFLIHEGLVNERGVALAFSRLNELTATRMTGMADPLTV